MGIQAGHVSGGIRMNGGHVEVDQVKGPVSTKHGTYDYPDRTVSVSDNQVYDADTGEHLHPNR